MRAESCKTFCSLCTNLNDAGNCGFIPIWRHPAVDRKKTCRVFHWCFVSTLSPLHRHAEQFLFLLNVSLLYVEGYILSSPTRANNNWTTEKTHKLYTDFKSRNWNLVRFFFLIFPFFLFLSGAELMIHCLILYKIYYLMTRFLMFFCLFCFVVIINGFSV